MIPNHTLLFQVPPLCSLSYQAHPCLQSQDQLRNQHQFKNLQPHQRPIQHFLQPPGKSVPLSCRPWEQRDHDWLQTESFSGDCQARSKANPSEDKVRGWDPGGSKPADGWRGGVSIGFGTPVLWYLWWRRWTQREETA